jgi:hypothetical protein
MALHPDTMAVMTFPSWTEMIGIVIDSVKSIGAEEQAVNHHEEEDGLADEELWDLEEDISDDDRVTSHAFVGAVRYLKSNDVNLPVQLRKLEEDTPEVEEKDSKEEKPSDALPDFVPFKERPSPAPVDAILLFFALNNLLHHKALEAFKLLKGPDYKHTSTLGKKENAWIDAQIQILTATANSQNPALKSEVPAQGTATEGAPKPTETALKPTETPPAKAKAPLSWKSFLPRKEKEVTDKEKVPRRSKKKKVFQIAIQGRLGMRTTLGSKPERADQQKKWGSAYCILRGPLLEVHDLPYKEGTPPLFTLDIGMYRLFALCPDEGRRLGIFRLVMEQSGY